MSATAVKCGVSRVQVASGSPRSVGWTRAPQKLAWVRRKQTAYNFKDFVFCHPKPGTDIITDTEPDSSAAVHAEVGRRGKPYFYCICVDKKEKKKKKKRQRLNY